MTAQSSVDLSKIPMGYWMSNLGYRMWYPNPFLEMTADEQYDHNLKIDPNFDPVLIDIPEIEFNWEGLK